MCVYKCKGDHGFSSVLCYIMYMCSPTLFILKTGKLLHSIAVMHELLKK